MELVSDLNAICLADKLKSPEGNKKWYSAKRPNQSLSSPVHCSALLRESDLSVQQTGVVLMGCVLPIHAKPRLLTA